jgi:hypothetical protein
VNRSQLFQGDDDDDSKLFRKAEEYVLENFPNPDRIGCPGPAVLRAFVESPEEMDLTDLCGLHILQCAECTRYLIELRREREQKVGVSRRRNRAFRWRVPLLWLAIASIFALVGLWLLLRTP